MRAHRGRIFYIAYGTLPKSNEKEGGTLAMFLFLSFFLFVMFIMFYIAYKTLHKSIEKEGETTAFVSPTFFVSLDF